MLISNSTLHLYFLFLYKQNVLIIFLNPSFIDTFSANPITQKVEVYCISVPILLNDNKVRDLGTICLSWQRWTETSVWFDYVGITSFHGCVVSAQAACKCSLSKPEWVEACSNCWLFFTCSLPFLFELYNDQIWFTWKNGWPNRQNPSAVTWQRIC